MSTELAGWILSGLLVLILASIILATQKGPKP